MALTYTSVDRVHNVLPNIGSNSAITSAQKVEMLEYAEAEVNARIAKRYTVPVAGTIPVLISIATDLGIYRILSRRIFTGQKLKDSAWPDRFNEALATLKEIEDGGISLVNSDGTVVGARTDIAKLKTTTDGYVPTFTDAIPFGDMVQDSDKVDAQITERGGFLRSLIK